MRVLIVYGTTDGQTAKVASTMATAAKTLGHEVTTFRGTEAPAPDAFDVIFVGGSVHYGFFQEEIQIYVAQHGAALNTKRTSLFCVTGTARSEQGKQDSAVFTDMLLEKSEWQPDHIEQIAGAFPFSKYPLWKRVFMRALLWREEPSLDTSQDLDFTDWMGIDVYVLYFLQSEHSLDGVTDSGVTEL